jgi:glycosyltransferase involved in cell wall biosynthesis
MNGRKVLLVVNAEWYFWSHRLALARALQAAGAEVTVAAAVERGYDGAIRAAGLRFVPLCLRRRSTSLRTESASLLELRRLYQQVRPDLVHHFTIKPVIYGSLAARAVRVPRVVNTIPGLGSTFRADTWKRRLVRSGVSSAYRLALAGDHVRVIFQNPQDRDYFVAHGLVAAGRSSVIRGSGVDIETFHPAPEPGGVPIVLLASRLLWDKGVQEFVDAARLVRQAGVPCRFVLVGIPDDENPNSVPEAVLRGWHAEGIVEWWGLRNDMPAVLQQATVVTLPSYYPEGVPKILLEAAATQRAIVTTDTPGCREVVQHDRTGLLVPPRAADALADAIMTALGDAALRQRLAAAARACVAEEFEEKLVIGQTMAVYQALLQRH